jgi:hypothetical protein
VAYPGDHPLEFRSFAFEIRSDRDIVSPSPPVIFVIHPGRAFGSGTPSIAASAAPN